MPIAMCAILLLACSSIMCLVGFFVGRCARKLPIIDDNLPWTMHRGYMQRTTDGNQTIISCEPDPIRWGRKLGVSCSTGQRSVKVDAA